MIDPGKLELKDGSKVEDHLNDEFIQHMMNVAETMGFCRGFSSAEPSWWLHGLILILAISLGFVLGRIV